MFKSIQHKLILPLFLLLLSVAGLTYMILKEDYVYAALFVLGTIFSFSLLNKHYRKFNQNILFLLNALDNGDYSFHFSVTKLSKREKELNVMLNRIKEIVAHARTEVIANEKFLSLVVESVSTGIVVLDERNNVHNVNQAALQLMGLTVFTHIDQLNRVNTSLPLMIREMKVGDQVQTSFINERESMLVSLSLSEMKSRRGLLKIITLNNIGNELEAKEMESWIRLIRVMTHEIMNSVAPITSLSETLLQAYQHTHGKETGNDGLYNNTVEAFETINATAKSLLSFVESYRKFTGIPKPNLRLVALRPLVDRVLLLESARLRECNVNVQVLEESPSICADADEGQITQVLVNLIRNAEQALHEKKQGCISIKIKRSLTSDKPLIDVCNNGTPISSDLAPHIFIPFFTTKESGTGIGLSLSRYIMRLHGGNLRHHTSVDDWTVFSMVF